MSRQLADQPHRQRRAPIEDAARRDSRAAAKLGRRGVVVRLAGVDPLDFGPVELDVAGSAIGRVGKAALQRRERNRHEEQRHDQKHRQRDPGVRARTGRIDL